MSLADRVEILWRSLCDARGGPGLYVARRIIDNPQAHLDALVEAGVLDKTPCGLPDAHYRVVQSHKHTWRVAMDVDKVNAHVGTSVRLICHECHETTDVANELPIEVPS